jgi:hypothetical protein
VTELLTNLANVRIRDPHILADAATRTYYLTASAGRDERHPHGGVVVWRTADLLSWEGPETVYAVPEDAWGRRGVWAPEMHAYGGRYYLFATLNSDAPLPPGAQRPFGVVPDGWPDLVRRGTQLFVSDSPLGPFERLANAPHPPAELMTLDGTLWVEDGQPWMVYCHEWVQVVDGTVDAVRLTQDLSATVGEPVRLFRGSDAPWGTGSQRGPTSFVTDGPCLFRTRTGRLLMVWSSFIQGVYATGLAISESGGVLGPWRQQAKPVYTRDGGHATVFTTFEGQLRLVLHAPNRVPDERVHLFALEDLGDTVALR